jgi:SAM-dependent methyltransferase
MRSGDPDKVPLERSGDGLRCPVCATAYPIHAEAGYVDLVPRRRVGDVTRYADHEFHERLGVVDAPPLLSARVRADMMWRMLGLEDEGRPEVLDLGCGAGKLALFCAGRGARAAGVDVAPFFLARATREVELVLGDLRRLPFRKGSFPRAYSLDVLEHLDEEGVREVLLEARRVLGPAGRLFVYTHAMESSRIAGFQRAVNRFARHLGERGLIDSEREAMRKSDHVNAIRSHEHFEELCAGAGLYVADRRYYNVLFKAVIEDVLLRLFEQWRRKRHPSAHESVPEDHRAPAPGSHVTVGAPPPPRWQLAVASALTWLLKLDVVLFGGVRTGPFFGLLRPVPARPDTR